MSTIVVVEENELRRLVKESMAEVLHLGINKPGKMEYPQQKSHYYAGNKWQQY
jgi:hypothetical protein